MVRVLFFCKYNTKGEKIIHSICNSIKGQKHVFSRSCRKLEKHPLKIREIVQKQEYKKMQHISVNLTGDELTTYYNCANGKFWFKGNALTIVPSKDVTNNASCELFF